MPSVRQEARREARGEARLGESERGLVNELCRTIKEPKMIRKPSTSVRAQATMCGTLPTTRKSCTTFCTPSIAAKSLAEFLREAYGIGIVSKVN